MAKTSKQFIQDLPKIYGTYTGGFLLFIIVMGIAEKMGVSGRNIGLMFVGFTIFIYALIGWISRTTDVDEYYLAGKKVPTVFNGMATAADWMSGASFVAMAGGIYFGGYTYMAVLILLIASFTYVTAQITATGSIAQKALSTPAFPVSFEFGCWTGLITILLCSMLGGMRSVTWSQVAQYIVLIIAYLIPIFWISWKYNFGIFPHIMLGDEVTRLAALEQQYGLVKHSKDVMDAAKIPSDALGNATALKYIVSGHSAVPAGHEVAWRYISLALCMMIGTASLPHILMRYFTTPTVTSARRSVGWSLFFIGLLYLSAPMLATVSKISLMDPNLPTAIIGKKIADVTQIEWVKNWLAVGQVKIVDLNNDGILQLSEWFMNEDVVVLATPEIAGLPYVISGLVAAGGLAAAMSTADGLILAMANAISHDIYYKMIDPKASVQKRLIVARVLLVVL
ncbi:MAG: cation acetate symporter, partial [Proteobacteria bacterium]|nr:cation acetate symporter [Candidatus Fonsibacter lacus]